MNTVPADIVADHDPKDGAYLRMCARFGVIPDPNPARRGAGEDLATGELARAIGVSVPAAHGAYQAWCEGRGLAPLPGYRGRSSWAPWIVERYLSGYEPAEIAAALTKASTYAYPEAQVERILEALGVAVNPLHKALRVKA